MSGQSLTEWRSGTGKVIRLGDTVRVDPRPDIRRSGTYRYTVKSIVDWDRGTVEVTVFGGKPGHQGWHTFIPDVLHVVRQGVTA